MPTDTAEPTAVAQLENLTDLDATAPTADAPTEADNAGAPVPSKAGVLEDKHPAELVIAANVRENFHLEDHPDYTESIREHGVKEPIWAIRMPDGRLVVRNGHVRTLTALAFEQESVPVRITEFDPTVDAKEAEILRVFDQITTNTYVPLTEGDIAGGIALALELGASPTRIGKALQKKRADVKLAGKIGASRTARGLIDSKQLDFEQAAILAEYETLGDTDAVQELLNVHRGHFHYTAKRIAADREEQRAFLAAALPYAEIGCGVLTGDHPEVAAGPELVPVTDIIDGDGTAISLEHIQADPEGWLVWIELDEHQDVVERDTGAVVDYASVDWQTAGSTDRTPREGLRHADEVERRDRWLVEFWLPAEQLDARGWRRGREDSDDPADVDGSDGIEVDTTGSDEQNAQIRAAATAKAVEDREAERQARRRVRVLNKQGEAAKETRIEFLVLYLKRKTAPPNAWKFIAEALATNSTLLGESYALENAFKLLGLEGGSWRRHELLEAIESAKPPRCLVIVLALVLGAYEKRTGRDCWRFSDKGVKHYMSFLAEIGHQLVPVELAAAGTLDCETIDLDNPVQTVDLDQAADPNEAADLAQAA
ncbi:ParB/Srx family N-terminal domain-containing protein [Nocardia iowensis]|uniref:ParB/Srx family N-terminal domain-containing protein n=1 Tax=Nocardia iowensis TaxID=204891 RepID=A0ABX8S2C1_NOCIO|nr:ParB/Srx family N-terminal domain-containing protein [Nocardia iowensis]QXN94760.1 ParB/Srx family N-terminal domain-containing protein [Nocardia iowensis]